MGEIRRINLCFSMDRREDREVYEKIISQRNKTEYVIQSILKNNNINSFCINEDKMKEIIKKAISEINISLKTEKYMQDDIPDDVFDIIDKL